MPVNRNIGNNLKGWINFYPFFMSKNGSQSGFANPAAGQRGARRKDSPAQAILRPLQKIIPDRPHLAAAGTGDGLQRRANCLGTQTRVVRTRAGQLRVL